MGLAMKPPLRAIGRTFELAAVDSCSSSMLPMLLCAVSAGLRAPAMGAGPVSACTSDLMLATAHKSWGVRVS